MIQYNIKHDKFKDVSFFSERDGSLGIFWDAKSVSFRYKNEYHLHLFGLIQFYKNNFTVKLVYDSIIAKSNDNFYQKLLYRQ